MLFYRALLVDRNPVTAPSNPIASGVFRNTNANTLIPFNFYFSNQPTFSDLDDNNLVLSDSVTFSTTPSIQLFGADNNTNIISDLVSFKTEAIPALYGPNENESLTDAFSFGTFADTNQFINPNDSVNLPFTFKAV